ncbi:sodium-dependent glucose transporter 1B-like [Amblyomma americanum]
MPSQSGQMLLRLGRTCNLSLGCMGVGLNHALKGVALLYLVEIYRSDISSVSHLITTRCVGALLGSLVGGKLYDAYNVQTMSILTMVIACVTVLMIPLSGSLALAHAMVFFSGISSGAFDTGANVWIIRMWPENSNPALQVFHLAYAVGCLVAPLIGEPFLSTTVGREALNQTANLTAYLTSNDSGYSPFEPLLNGTGNHDNVVGESRVYYAFSIVSAFHLPLLIAMVALYLIDSSDVKLSHGGEGDAPKAEDVFFTRALLALLSTYVCVYVALEGTSTQMLTAYAVKGVLHFTKSTAARLAADYFFCFAASRLGAALVTVKMSPFQMLVISHVILVVTGTALLVWGSSSAPLLWACSAFMGIGQAPVYGAVVAWTVSYMNITNMMMSIVIVTVGIGALLPPLLVGQFLEHSPKLFLYVSFASALLCAAIFVAMYFYVRKRPLLNVERENVSL